MNCIQCYRPIDKNSLCTECKRLNSLEKKRRDRRELKLRFVKAYGGRCQCPGGCDVTEPDFLGVGHTDNLGFLHRKQTGGAGYQTYRDLEARHWPKDKYRLECYNCNFARNYFGGCPHERKRCLPESKSNMQNEQNGMIINITREQLEAWKRGDLIIEFSVDGPPLVNPQDFERWVRERKLKPNLRQVIPQWGENRTVYSEEIPALESLDSVESLPAEPNQKESNGHCIK